MPISILIAFGIPAYEKVKKEKKEMSKNIFW